MKFSFRKKNLLQVASSLFPKKEVTALFHELTDKREFLQILAERYGKLEADVRRSIAQKLNVLVLDTVPAFDINSLPPSLSIEPFWRFGVVPIFRDEHVIGVCCVDPGTVPYVKKEWDSLPIYLCSWFAIRKSLETSERNYIEVAAPSDDVLSEIFKLIISESVGFGGDLIKILFSEEICQYRFKTSSQREASGTIDFRIKDSFYSFLKDRQHKVLLVDGREISVIQTNHQEFELRLSEKNITNIIPFPSVKPLVRPKSVMLIDDDQVFIKVIERFFARSNIPLYTFSSANEALVFLKKSSPPGIILSDVHMPEMYGVDLIAALKSREETKDIPVISLTADDTADTHLHLLEAGAHLVLSKRTDSRVLLAYIKKILNLTESPQNIAYSIP